MHVCMYVGIVLTSGMNIETHAVNFFIVLRIILGVTLYVCECMYSYLTTLVYITLLLIFSVSVCNVVSGGKRRSDVRAANHG